MLETGKLKTVLVVVTVFCLVLPALLCMAADSAEEERLLGDVDDGSLGVAVHNHRLYDEEGEKISPDDFLVLPFSTKQTCGDCHNYQIISKGWHFNVAAPNTPPGRKGQPYIFVDTATATQIPLSYRKWPGVYHPLQLGISPWKFTQLFGGHTPGGGAGEIDTEDYDEIMRQMVSGKLEINCLSCHNAHFGQDQAEFASQISRQNFRWAASGACEFASVSGSAVDMPDTYDPMMPGGLDNPDKIPPTISYGKNAFDDKGNVSFDIVRKPANKRCYFCHSNKSLSQQPGHETADEDVHITSGLACVDCHHNGLDHNITRGYEDESSGSDTSASSCKGCHSAGHLGAPVAEHRGFPPVHFEKLTCTACHSGPKPADIAGGVKTSRTHLLGTHNVNKADNCLPHITTVVLAEGPDGKIGPCNLIWPAFWAALNDDGQAAPIAIDVVSSVAAKVITGELLSASGDWPKIDKEHIGQILQLLSSQPVEGQPVYICGGKLHKLGDDNKLESVAHESAKPYLWPVAHNVRPAVQSLGVKACDECHSTDSAFFFSDVGVDGPLTAGQGKVCSMIDFQGLAPFYTKAFAWSFMFRPWFKAVTLCSVAVISMVLLLYGLKMLACITRIMTGRE